MSYTYTGNPATVPADAVRWWAGDTDITSALLTDGEVLYAITMAPSDARMAAALCLDALAAKYARQANVTVGEVSQQLGAVAKNFSDRANGLRNEAGKLAVPFFGGQSLAGKDTLSQDTDAVQPPFQLKQFDNPFTRQFDGTADDTSDLAP